MQHTKTGWAYIAIGVAAFVTLLRVTSAEQPEPQVAQLNGEIPSHVYQPYDAVEYDQTYARYSEETVLGPIQELREQGAETASRDPRCDQVAMSELSLFRSTEEVIVVFTDCENGQRYYSERRIR